MIMCVKKSPVNSTWFCRLFILLKVVFVYFILAVYITFTTHKRHRSVQTGMGVAKALFANFPLLEILG